ncbi:hypothetical protein [Enterococcus hirae]|uniref:hypothetical protein n=1 Tax=Enterococcus hirae TaxID=1354 RepID=UPI001A967397|nr:hypothetical protein [Enterococcus hirae]MBO1101454.1 hypothetical protein [Enterococcus hirae]
MSNVVYQLTMEDICQFLTNREHLNEVTRRVKHSFYCMEELNQKQYNHFDYYLLFAQFLTDETELALVFGNGYMLTVPQSFLDEYKKEIANPRGDNFEMRKELYETFHLDKTEQMLVELERKNIAYQMFVLKKSN